MSSEHTSAPGLFPETNAKDCYQCGKCTAGCPVADKMDQVPNQMVRWVMLNDLKSAMACKAPWVCVSCQTCSTRCPQSVDIAGVMDAVRQASAEHDAVPAEVRRIQVFQQAFLDNIRRFGRLNEVDLVGQFKVKAFFTDFSVPLLLADTLMPPLMMQRGKFHLLGEKVKDRALVRRIFDRCLKEHAVPGEHEA